MPIVGSPIYEVEGRKYIDIDGIRLKIPFKYGHISGLKVNGFKSVYELRQGDFIKSFEMAEKKWNGSVFYILKSITVE